VGGVGHFPEIMVRSLFTFTTIGLTILSLTLGSCRPEIKPQQQSKPSAAKIEPKLELDGLSFEQVDNQGKPLWKVRAEKGIYAPDRKRAKVTNLDGDLYQDGQIVLHVTAKSGEVEQEGEKVFLRGDVITKAIKNNLVIVGQEVEWQPKADSLTIRDRVQANHPQFQANAERGQYFSRKQQLELSGKITAFTNEPRLAMQTEQLTWLVKDQQVIGKTPTQIQRYQGQQVTATVTANSSTTSLDRKIINLLGNVQLNATKPLIQVNGESFSWEIDRELITADRPLKIVHQQEQATFTANNGQVDLQSSLATLSGDARGVATRNQAKLRADKLVWEMTSQQLVGTGNVVYQQVRPQIKFTGNRGVGKLQDQSIVISSDRRQQVQTEIVPK
jgi:LPS export ABC transporter protein LptC